MLWRGPSICLAGATCYLTRPRLFPIAACSILPCPGQRRPKSTCQQAPAEGQPPVWGPPLLGRVGWVRRNMVPFRRLLNRGAIVLPVGGPFGRLLNFSSGIIGKRPFLAKSWPGAFWKQISAIWPPLRPAIEFLFWDHWETAVFG